MLLRRFDADLRKFDAKLRKPPKEAIEAIEARIEAMRKRLEEPHDDGLHQRANGVGRIVPRCGRLLSVAGDTWTTVVIPMLEFIANLEDDSETGFVGMVDTEIIAETIDQPVAIVRIELKRLLDDQLLSGKLYVTSEDETTIVEPRLTARGARVVKRWPPDDASALLLELIDQRIEQSTGEERTRWQRARQSLTDVGTNAFGGLLVEAGKLGLGALG